MNSSPSGYFVIIEVPLNEIKAALQAFQNEVDAAITGLSGGVGLVNSVFGRSGTVTAQTDDYTWAQINKATSSLADLATRSASDLSSGTLPDAQFPTTLPAVSGANLTGVLKPANIGSTVQAWDADLDAIAAISGTLGLLKKTAANTWSLDTNTYLTANQTITLSGDVSGSGSTAITTTIGAAKVTNTMLAGSIDATKIADGSVTSTEFQYINSLTSNAQTQIDSKVPATRNLIAGAGLTGGGDLSADRTFTVGAGLGITVNADDVALTTPGTLTVSTTNSSTGNHTHAITSSSNPGAAASLLATDVSGYLTTVRYTATDYIFVNNTTANLYLKNTSTGWQSATTLIVTPQSGNAVRSTSFTSGLSGWGINAAGDAEFNNVTTRGELRASVFKVNEIAATAGTLGVFYSASSLNSDATTPSIASSFTFDAKNSDSGAMLFGGGEVVRFKAYVSPTGTIIGDAWATITGRTNHTTYATYTATMNSGSTATVFRAGTAIADYGVSGAGFITLSADGTVGSSPNLTMGTHAGSPWTTQTTLLRLGNLNGSYGYATDVYGFAAGDNSASWIKIDPTNGIRLGYNTTTKVQIDASGNASFAGSITASSGTIGGLNIASNKIYSGTGNYANADTAFYLDVDGAFSLKDKLSWNGTILTISGGGSFTGDLTGSSMALTGKLTMSGVSSAIAIGSTPPTSASAGTGIWIDRNGLIALNSSSQKVILNNNGLTAGNVSLTDAGILANGSGQINIEYNSTSTHAGIRIGISGAGTAGSNVWSPALHFQANGNTGGADIEFDFYTELRATSKFSAGALLATKFGSTDVFTIRGDGLVTIPGVIASGSGPTTLTDSAGKILAAALNIVTAAKGGFGSDVSASSGVPLFASGTPTFTSTSGTGNFVRVTSPTITTLTNSGLLTVTMSGAGQNITIGGAGTGFTYAKMTNTTGELWWGLEGSGGGDLFGGTSGYDAVIGSVANKNFHLVSNSAVRLTVKADGGIVVGSPTGGSKGAGTINAIAVYDDNVLLSDWLWDIHYDGRAKDDDKYYLGQQLFSLEATRAVTEAERRLPWMPTRAAFETSRSLGKVTTNLWQGQEQQQVYIFQLSDRIKSLEAKIADLEKRRN